MKKKLGLVLFLLPVFAVAETWNRTNDPSNMDTNYVYQLTALPLKAVLPKNKTPWASSYWPRKNGSINYRWNSPNPRGFNLNYATRETVARMTEAQLAQLSPAEKFDLAQGHYDYPLSTSVAQGATPTAKDYEGVCDGWTAAAIEFAEPAPVKIQNPEGIMIPFGSSDVKALMSYDVSLNAPKGSLGAVFAGSYCVVPFGLSLGTPSCTDLNPGAFHVIVANQIGLKKESFAVDIDPSKETWNQPVYGYEFEITGRAQVSGVAQAYTVHAKFTYAEDDPEEAERKVNVFSWNPTVGTPQYLATTLELDYVLELDYSGRIIGGSWLGSSQKKHPDLFWMPTNKIQWTEEFQFLNQIYKPSF